MDCVKDPNLYDECKKIVKLWECNFTKKKGRPPSKFDIREADKHVRHAYSMYFKLKTAALEQSLSDIFREDDDDEQPINTENQEEHQHQQQEEQVVLDPKPEVTNGVWGEHLNKKTVEVKQSKMSEQKTDKTNSALTQKLFKNSKFLKRNPRKSFQLNKSSCSLNLSQSLSQPISSSQYDEIEKTDISADMSSSSFNSTLPICSDTRQISLQSVNVITQLLEARNSSIRHVDKGWLQRVSSNTGTKLLDSSNAPLNEKPNDFDSDDVISDSDEETINSLHVSKRLKLSSTINHSKSTDNNTNIENKNTELENVDKSVNVEIVKQSEIPIKDTESDDDEEIQKKPPKKSKKITSDEDSEYEEPKPILKRKRNARKSTKSISKDNKTTRSNKEKDIPEDIVEKTEEYEMEYSIKPPPPTVPRVNIKNVLVESKIVEIENSATSSQPIQTQERIRKQIAKDKLLKKIQSGSLNENFVRVDIKKKVYVRGKKHMNYSKFKKQMYKNKKKALYGPDMDMGGCDGGELTCFKCGKTGHFARQCKAQQADKLLPLGAVEEDESTLPSLEEASKMARDSALAIRAPNQLLTELESTIKAQISPTKDTTSDEEGENKDSEYEFDDDDDLESFIKNTDIVEKTTEMSQKWLELLEENQVKPVYELNEDGTLPETPEEVFEALKKFGHTSFREGQEQAVMRILCGQSTLVTLSTGSGKSLCYQLPAYLYAKRARCVTLVISPLVSLMEDQVAGIPSFFNAACLHTNQTATQKEKVLKLIDSGDLNILLVSPEAVTSGEKKSGFGSLLRKLPAIAFACIDEAHCVSQWSHNFRPSYLVICRVLRERLGIQTILGLTATSTHATSSSIVEHLKIPDGHDGVICDIPLPDNLYLSVSSDVQRDAALKCLLSCDPFDAFDSIIIYCTRREECERIASHLRTGLRFKSGVPPPLKKYKSLSQVAEPYHAGLPASKRRTVQNAFMTGYVRIVVATVAFGMGINKANIRGVIHYNMPRNFESYVQEVGRAGRDGLPAHCHLFLDSEGRDQNELRRHIYANSMDRHVIRKLLKKIFVPCNCKGVCPRHEVAFPIEQTVKELDVPEENISTLLCYLELHERRYLEVLTPVYTTCKIISYGTGQNIIKAAKDCPPLAMALALQKSDSIKKNVFEFPVVDVSSAMGWDSGMVKSKLKNLEWSHLLGKRSTLTVEFSNLGFHLRAPGNLPPSELDDALDSLFAKKKEQETTSLQQLQVVYNTLTAVTEKHYHLCLTEEYSKKSAKLKRQIREYFSSEQPLKHIELTANKCVANEQQIIADVRSLVAMYRDNNFTGRAAARIFHGIQSPNYPAVIWGRCKFWRAHLNSDFSQVCQICTTEILKLR